MGLVDKRKGYFWLVGACIGFLLTGLLFAMVFNTRSIRISPIQIAYYVLFPSFTAALGFLTYLRTVGLAISLAGLAIVASLVVIEGITVLPFALPITIPLIATTFEFWAIYELSQHMNRQKTFMTVATTCCVSLALGLFLSYALGLQLPRV